VRFPVAKASDPALDGVSVVIWTTTPWTIPGNRAVAFGPEMDYVVVEVVQVAPDSLAKVGERLLVAKALAPNLLEVGIVTMNQVAELRGTALMGTVCRHPLAGSGYDFDVPLLPGDHVTTEVGTGLVHTAPGHGVEDFEVGQKFGLDAPQTVGDDGRFYDHVPLFAGEHVFKVDGKVADALAERGRLLHRGKVVHSYPHSWRSKAPLIFRNTPQWFIGMELNDLRKTALQAIADTTFFPPTGRNRLGSMIESRPDWCISRQRAWGVPIAVFVNKSTGEPLRDPAVLERIVAAVDAEGADTWFSSDPSRFLGNDHDPDDYEQIKDILDVWFESGCTHSFVLEARDDLQWPASLYLEGSDQHRGWFHSSLLESCGTRGRAPYDAVLTHGFVLAEAGVKMSKSLGNVVAPQEIIKNFGADILRIWVVASDYSEDLKISPKILEYQADAYRRLRNTLRYVLGNLDGFAAAERLPHAEMPELERWVLHRLCELDELVRRCCAEYDFHTLFTQLHNFCAVDLSAFYFDVRKDALYCDDPRSVSRRAARTVLDELFSCLTAWLAPIIAFTAEEAWLARHGGNPPVGQESVHLRTFPDVPAAWRDETLARKWETVRAVRRVVTGALEIERAEKRIGASLQAHPTVHLGAEHRAALAGVDLAEVTITSGLTVSDAPPPAGAFALPDVPGVAVVAGKADGAKCERCWKVLPEVGSVAAHPTLCHRCADAVEHRLADAG